MMKKIYGIASILFLLCMQTTAQQNMTLYNMNSIPQRNTVNPALQFTGTGYVGFPFLSSAGFSLSNSAFKYSDFVRHSDDDSLYLDPANMINKLKDQNFINASIQDELLAFGFRIKKSFFGFSAIEKINLQFSYPKEMIEFLWKGNAAMLDKEVTLKFGVNASHYREYSFIYSTTIRNNFSLGMRLKYLYGMENISTNSSQVTLYTNPNSFAITAKSNINIYTSGIEDNTFDEFSMSEYAFGRNNTGYGIDFGFAYKFSEKINLSASVLDIGKIKWSSHISNYKSKNENGEFTYYGIDLNQFISDTSGADEIFQDLIDTLESSFEIQTLHNAYETQLPMQIYFGSTYNLNEKNSIAVLIHSAKTEDKFHTDYSVSYNKTTGKWLNLALSYSVINKSYDNIGMGIALSPGNFRLYFVSDNMYGTIFPTRSQNANFRAGIDFIFSKNTKTEPPVSE